MSAILLELKALKDQRFDQQQTVNSMNVSGPIGNAALPRSSMIFTQDSLSNLGQSLVMNREQKKDGVGAKSALDKNSMKESYTFDD